MTNQQACQRIDKELERMRKERVRWFDGMDGRRKVPTRYVFMGRGKPRKLPDSYFE